MKGTRHSEERIIAFLLICIGAQIAWHGLHPLLVLAAPSSVPEFGVVVQETWN